MELQFVDNAKIDARTRKQIRSQVMIGRNAGKKRQRIKSERKKLASLASKSSLENGRRFGHNLPNIVVPKRWDEFSTFAYPRELESHMRQILRAFFLSTAHIMYPKELCFDLFDSHSIFFQLFQSDEAFFHCLLALAEGQRYTFTGAEGVSDLTLYFLANTYRCINRDLEKKEAPSYGIAASVMSLAMHENLFGMTGRSELHLHALQRIVELKGGLQAFEGHKALLHKICRSDLEYALQVGVRPRFHRDAFPRDEVNEALFGHLLSNIQSLSLKDSIIREVFKDCNDVSRILNDNGTSHKMSPFSFQEILISVATRLLRAHPLDSASPTSSIDTICYLALLALVTTMLIRGQPHHQQYYYLLTAKFRRALRDFATDNKRFKLWIYFVASLSVFEDERDKGWLTHTIGSIIDELRISKYQEALKVLKMFPWVRYFHDEPVQNLR